MPQWSFSLKQFRFLLEAGWLLMDDEQFQYLSMITLHSTRTASVKERPLLPTPAANTKELIDEDAVVLQSKISQIKDLFPDYGNGFLAACLEVYNQNPEEVIQRILEGTLHEDLKQLDTSLETMPQPKPASTLSRKDKGKGKLIESPINILDTYKEQLTKGPSLPASSTSSTSSTTVGRFVRKAKDDALDNTTLDARNETDKAKNAAMFAQYEYEDEYDDSFDDLGLSVGESTLEESETFGNRAGSNSGVESAPSGGSKWGSRKKPQFYVKDGKNYSYKVAGSVAVANASEASLVKEAQGELIYGLGRGGNIPLGAAKKLTEYQQQQEAEEKDDNQRSEASRANERESRRNSRVQGRGRGGRGGRGMARESNGGQDDKNNNNKNNNNSNGSEAENRGNNMGQRGRGRRGGGGGRNHHHKDRAMRKHMASVSGF